MPVGNPTAQQKEIVNKMTTEINEKAGNFIVVGVDGSESSKSALQWAVQLAPLVAGEIRVIIAWEYPMMFGWEGGIPDWGNLSDNAESILKKSLESVFGNDHPKGLVSKVRQGHPTSILLEESQNAKMLIVGSRGLGGFASLLLGSVSAYCAEHAKCPVLVVHNNKK